MNIQLSKAEWFAAHAPEPPDWYNYTHETPVQTPPQVRYWLNNRPDDLELFLRYYDDEFGQWTTGSAPHVPVAFKKEVEDYIIKRTQAVERRDAVIERNKIERLFHWKKYYGEKMAELFSRNNARHFYALIHYPNDPSVGIFSQYYEMEIPKWPDEEPHLREETRKAIAAMYQTLDDESNCRVYFSDELDKEY